MKNSKQAESMEAQKNCGRFFRVMLREVQPEHVPDMIHMLWLFGHTDKEIRIPDRGLWRMKMPHGYALVGEGPVGMRIEPPPGQVIERVSRPHDCVQAGKDRLAARRPDLDEHDTQSILALCQRVRQTARPERDQVLIQLFGLNLDRCRPKALDAVEMLIYDLITGDTE